MSSVLLYYFWGKPGNEKVAFLVIPRATLHDYLIFPGSDTAFQQMPKILLLLSKLLWEA